MRKFYEYFNRHNKKQRKSIADAKAHKLTGKLSDKVSDKYGVYAFRVKPWITWREIQAYVAHQKKAKAG